jgi:hypothetical protein
MSKGKGTAPAADNVVELRPQKALQRKSEQKWGADVMARGFCILPSMLFRAQHRLGLNLGQLALVVQIAEFWWEASKNPYPKKETLAARLGISPKQVQRIAKQLEDRGYLKRVRRVTGRGQTSNGYDLAGLVKKLQELAPEFAEAAVAKRKVERRGGLKVKSA